MLPGSIWCVFYVIVHPSDEGQGKVYFENLDTKVTHCDVYKQIEMVRLVLGV